MGPCAPRRLRQLKRKAHSDGISAPVCDAWCGYRSGPLLPAGLASARLRLFAHGGAWEVDDLGDCQGATIREKRGGK